MKLLKKFPNLFPLFIEDSFLYLSKGNAIFRMDINTFGFEEVFRFPFDLFRNFTYQNKYLNRIFRKGISLGIKHNRFFYCAYDRKIFELDLANKKINGIFHLEKGRSPLDITIIKNLNEFKDGLYFGEYFSNSRKESVRIFRKCSENNWEVVFTFKQGEINHVHSIVSDHIRNCIWILTGDFGEGACIWKVTNDFKNVKPIKRGSQQFRACVAFPINEGLLYATDSQFEQNNIYLLRELGKRNFETNKLIPINGSCIYGCKVGDQFVMSTSTEPGDRFDIKIFKLLDRRKGDGINENKSDIIVGNLSNGFKVKKEFFKDAFPYGLFQFGTVKFPKGINLTNMLFTYSIANKNNDQTLEIWEL